MKKIDLFKLILSMLDSATPETLGKSMYNVHHDGVFSLVIRGTENGKLMRVFFADKKIKPYAVQLHSHRYDILLTTIKGNIKHHIAVPSKSTDIESLEMSSFEYFSPLNGGSGLSYIGESYYIIKDHSIPVGATSYLTHKDIHTMSCSKGSIWIVEELGFSSESSIVLGIPFVLDGLYTPPSQFQINDKCQILRKELKSLISHYELVEK